MPVQEKPKMIHQLIIDIPGEGLDDTLQEEQPMLREALAVALYQKKRISLKDGMSLTGVGRKAFEEKLAEFGVPMMDEHEFNDELNAANRYITNRRQ